MKIARFFMLAAVFFATSFASFRASAQVDWLDLLFRLALHAPASAGTAGGRESQLNWLIIGVDDSNPRAPELESVWLVVHNEITHKAPFVAIFPDPDRPQQNQRLAEAFGQDGRKPGDTFWETLHAGQWDGYLITTQSETVRVVNAMGGIPLGGQLTQGRQAVAQIPSWKDDPQQAIAMQESLLRGICHQLEHTNASGKRKTAWKLVLGAPIDEIPVFLQAANWAVKFREHEDFSCNFPDTSGQRSAQVSP